MNRRDFIAGTAALLVSPRRSSAQGTPRRVGYLDFAPIYLPLFKVWQDSVRDHGRIEGKNLIVDYRSAEGHAERLAPLATELVALKPDVLFGAGPQVALALKSATATITSRGIRLADIGIAELPHLDAQASTLYARPSPARR